MITLNPREKRILTVGGCFVGALLVYLLVISPYLKAVELLERRIAQKAEELQEVQTLQGEYLGLRDKVSTLETMVRSTSGFSLLSFLENLAEKNDIKKQITYMKPVTSPAHEKYRESSVEMKVEGITLKQLVDYLHGIEQSREQIRIKRLNIAKKRDGGYLDITFQASAFEPVSPAAVAETRKEPNP
jgi:general secretion pathway protein M